MLAVASVYGFTWQIVGYVSWRRKSKGLAVLSLNFCPLLVVPLWSLMPPTRGYLSNRSVLCTVPRYELQQQQQHFLSNCHGIAEMRQKSLKRRCLSNFNVSVFQAKRQQAACLLRDMAWISVDIVPLGLCFTFFFFNIYLPFVYLKIVCLTKTRLAVCSPTASSDRTDIC